MILEKGDLFSVTRGIELRSSISMPFSNIDTITTEKQYDRSYNNCIFETLGQNGPCIACRCVYAPEYKKKYLQGHKFMLNMDEIQIWPIEKGFLKELQ